MMDTPTTRTQSQTSLKFNSLYSTVYSASSFDCVIYLKLNKLD